MVVIDSSSKIGGGSVNDLMNSDRWKLIQPRCSDV